jgi:multisubunit Na+/H+ antiporter MnhC subunit
LSARVVVSQWLARTALLLLWSLVAWGVLLLLVTLGHVVQEGPGPALARLVPPSGASAWAWANPLSVALAVTAGLVAGGLYASGRRRRTS